MARQFIKCDLNGRKYTYHNDGAPVAVGDRVKLPSPKADGWLGGDVLEVDIDEPKTFTTKGILGLAPAVDEEE